MKILRYPNIPRYIYSGRIGEEYLNDFINLYLSNHDDYPDDFFKCKEMRQMALRISYDFFREINSQIEKDQKNNQYIAPKIIFYGDTGFSWPIISNSLSSNSLILCAGIGTNMTFEAQLASQTNSRIHLFDPSKHAIEHYNNFYHDRSDLILNKLGLHKKTGVISFFKDINPSVGSLSSVNLMNSNIHIELPVISIGDYLRKLKVNKVNYLKMDIEGAEYDVIENLLKSNIQVDQLSFEFDQPIPPWKSHKLINLLLLNGYMPLKFWGTNGFFINKKFANELCLFNYLTESKK